MVHGTVIHKCVTDYKFVFPLFIFYIIQSDLFNDHFSYVTTKWHMIALRIESMIMFSASVNMFLKFLKFLEE